MLFCVIFSASLVGFHGALAAQKSAFSTFPLNHPILTSLAFSPNSTTAYPSRSAETTAPPTGNCSNSCSYSQFDLSYITWSQMSITATYIAKTVLLVVNKNNNITRTTTISNPEIDFDKIATPTNLNSDGTVTASVVDNDGSTRIV